MKVVIRQKFFQLKKSLVSLETKKRLETLKKEMERLEILIDTAREKFFEEKKTSYEDMLKCTEPYSSQFKALWREKRLLQPVIINGKSKIGNFMTLKDFVKYCKWGGFTDYDGSGVYATKDGRKTSTSIQPSDVKAKQIRKDFSRIYWFNK